MVFMYFKALTNVMNVCFLSLPVPVLLYVLFIVWVK